MANHHKNAIRTGQVIVSFDASGCRYLQDVKVVPKGPVKAAEDQAGAEEDEDLDAGFGDDEEEFGANEEGAKGDQDEDFEEDPDEDMGDGNKDEEDAQNHQIANRSVKCSHNRPNAHHPSTDESNPSGGEDPDELDEPILPVAKRCKLRNIVTQRA
ncbi:hypothetical protein BN946_scf184867.g1 [Trametes cinnabarina]|uniref:Uncharacterized protein n=1 Tax=Pycnoporus cinnabarinus TaxID=5643 RepID=A0A060SPP3_PYCCI|nr:hypothetical protein BN946_scf184867.g1 [Trametes cinnabarina]